MGLSIFDIYKNRSYRDELTDALCNGVVNSSDFRDILDYVLDKKLHLFDSDELLGKLYEDEDDILDIILPSIRRLYIKVYQDPPTILKGSKLRLFFLIFDIDEYLTYLLVMIQDSKNSLRPFIYLDRTIETIQLIVDNHVANLFDRAYNFNGNIEQEIRDLTIKKLVDKRFDN
jgi:hypothetical protein